MKCYKCNKGMSDNVSLVPEDVKGTENRRWVCLDCKDDSVQVPEDVKNISGIFDDKFNN